MFVAPFQLIYPKTNDRTKKDKNPNKVTGKALQKEMEENHLLTDCDGNNISKYTESEKTKNVTETNPPKKTAKRRRLYKTSGIKNVLCFR